MNNFLIPVAVFVYNRYDKFRKTHESLLKNLDKNVPIYFFIDGPKNEDDKLKISKIIKIIEGNKYFKKKYLNTNKKNVGLKKNIINGINRVLTDFSEIIVIEDDILINRYFYEFMYLNLKKVYYSKNLGSITGYSFLEKKVSGYKYDVYFSLRHSSWGWGTWKHVWNKLDFEELKKENFISIKEKLDQAGTDIYRMLLRDQKLNMNSWSIYFDYFCIKNNLLCLAPTISMIQNIGFDAEATNTNKKIEKYNYDQFYNPQKYPKNIFLNNMICYKIKSKYSRSFIKLLKKILCI